MGMFLTKLWDEQCKIGIIFCQCQLCLLQTDLVTIIGF